MYTNSKLRFCTALKLQPTFTDVDKTLYHLLGSSNVRVWVHSGLTKDAARALKSMRPEPGFHAIIGDNTFVTDTYRRATLIVLTCILYIH